MLMIPKPPQKKPTLNKENSSFHKIFNFYPKNNFNFFRRFPFDCTIAKNWEFNPPQKGKTTTNTYTKYKKEALQFFPVFFYLKNRYA